MHFPATTLCVGGYLIIFNSLLVDLMSKLNIWKHCRADNEVLQAPLPPACQTHYINKEF